MKLITKNTDYAMRALILMASNGGKLFSVSEIAKQLKIPRPFLRRILQVLNKEGILTSFKGKGGGFRLVRPTEKIFLTDLISIFQGRIRLNQCFVRTKLCPNVKTCLLRKKIEEIENFTIRELKSLTIKSLK